MYIGLTEEQEALQKEVRAYYAELLTPETRAELAGGGGVGAPMRRVVRQMGEDGWLGVGWPTEWGGRGFTPVEQFLWFDEAMRAGAPVPMLTVNSVAPTIMQFGSDEQRSSTCRRSCAARSTSRSATPSRARARTWRRCAPRRCATATST